jgi:phenylacetate-coenzyme A ligase PaaK-like adenylate-forming protein
MSNILDKSHELANLGVKALFLAGEYVATAMRNELSRIWNCRIYTHYGLTEMGLGVAVECAAGDGYHFNEADLLLELIDPATGESVPPGSEGELVFTTLTREAMPLIRYRTHDSSRMIIEPCSCGASMLQKFAHVRKRAELTSALQTGDEIYPALFDDCLFEIPGLIDYQAILIRENNKECFEFIIEMADCCADSISDIEKKLLSIPAVSRGISSGTMHPPRIELERKNSLLRTDRSKKLIIDHR